MTACSFCSTRKGKRACPALGGEICPQCCGKHRLVEIQCPADCRWLGGLAVVRDGATGFTKEEFRAARDKLTTHVFAPKHKELLREALAFLLESDERAPAQRQDEPIPAWMESMLTAYLSYGHRDDDDRRAVDRFLVSHGRALSRGEVAALMTLQQAWGSMFEIVSVRTGSGFTVRDLILDESFEVTEVTGSVGIHPGEVQLAWLMPVGETMEMAGDSLKVPPGVVDAVRAELEAALADARAEHPGVPMRQLLAANADVALAALRDGLARAPRPQLTTTHGEPVMFCEAHYQIVDPDTVLARLATRADLQRHDDAPEPRFTWLDPALNPALGGSTVLGSIRIERDQLILETHARARLTRGRAMLELLLGAAVVHRADALTDPEVALRDHATSDDPGPPGSPSMPPELEAEMLATVLRDLYQGWLDEPVPALGDRTPRATARSPQGRAQVAALLDDFERDSQGQPGATPQLWNELRRELGIDERIPAGAGLTYHGDHAPDPARWLAADEVVRTEAIRAHHDTLAEHPDGPDPALHAAFHLIGENQVAAGQPPETAAAVARLIAGGTTRHEAIHAVMSIVATEVFTMLRDKRTYDRAGTTRALAKLRAEDWAGTLSRRPR